MESTTPEGRAATAAAAASAASEKILKKKIEELEAGHEHLKLEMTKLRISGAASDLKLSQYKIDNQNHRDSNSNNNNNNNNNYRSHSISPQRSRFNSPRRIILPGASGFDGSAATWKNNPSSNHRHPSPLHRENSAPNPKIPDIVPVVVVETDTSVGDCGGAAALNFTDKQYLNILHCMGKSVHIFDLDGSIIYWNHTAEKTYGYEASEVIGRDVNELLAEAKDYDALNDIIQRVRLGESWNGQFPVKNKTGGRFVVKVTNTPFYDDNGTLVGVICVSNDSLSFQELTPPLPSPKSSGDSSFSRLKSATSNKLGLDPEQPLQTAITSKLSYLASKVSFKLSNQVRLCIKTGDHTVHSEGGIEDNHHSGFFDVVPSDPREDVIASAGSTPRGDIPQSPLGVRSQLLTEMTPEFRGSGYESEGSLGVEKSITSKAEEWIASKGMSWPLKGRGQDGSGPKTKQFVWPWSHNDVGKKNNLSGANSETQTGEGNQPSNNEVSGSWFSSCNVNSTSSVSSCGSTSSNGINKVDAETDSSDCDILWEDLTVGEQIGQGSCGTVYHALWYGSDVAVKVFSRQEYSDDVIFSFKEEVSLMKRLRHPNVLLFMGVVTSPQRLCIITEFLPRGSLFRLLQRNTTKLDMRRRVQMAIDIARGMNYLHRYNPPIVHRDLKSSNLMVDKNWTVKVGDFGLSRLKHGTYLTSNTGKGTPQWMAPEVLRNEPSDEKSDIYSYGVVLWELATEKVPWDTLNQMQVIAAVGFMNQRLEIPKDVDPEWTAIILSCWQSDPQLRPSFQELLDKFKDLQRQYAIKLQATRSATTDSTQKEV